MTDEEILSQVRELREEEDIVTAEYLTRTSLIRKAIWGIQDQCPHRDMGAGSYTRWCKVCGKDWDTT